MRMDQIMWLLFASLFILGTRLNVFCQTVTQCENGDITNYEKEQTSYNYVLKKSRLSAIYNPRHPHSFQFYVPLADRDQKCQVVTRDGLVRSMAIKYAIENINNNATLSKWGKIGYQIDDVCDDLPTTMARGIEGISYHRPHSVCRDGFLKCDGDMKKTNITNITRQFIAVVGSGMSFTAVPLGSLTSLYDIPHIDFSSTSETLNDREIYQSFFRTVPPDTYQIQVFLEIFRKFKWNYVYLVGSDDDYGKLAIIKLKELAESQEGYEKVCIVGEDYIPYQSDSKTKSTIDTVIGNIEKQDKAKAVVLFMYVKGMGDLFLRRALSKNLTRVWLTSEAWHPDALNLPEDLKTQAHGIITVSIPTRPLPNFLKFMESDIKNNWKCNMWLINFLRNKIPGNQMDYVNFIEDANRFEIGNKTNATLLPLDELLIELNRLPFQTENMINAIRALGNGLFHAHEKLCNGYDPCNKTIYPGNVTREIYSRQYTTEHGGKASFRDDGTPNEAVYEINNLFWNGTSYAYQKVGTWYNSTGKIQNLQKSKIEWPYWLNKTGAHLDDYDLADVSKCHTDCLPGEYYVNKKDCCWECRNCSHRTVSTVRMASKCTPCTIFEHPVNGQSKCIKSPQTWLNVNEAEGVTMIAISAVGFLATVSATLFLLRSYKMTIYADISPHLLWISCALVVVTFTYGALHMIKPSDIFCAVRNSIFYLLLMMYAAILLIRTRFITKTLLKNSDESIGEKLSTAQFLFILMLFLLELVSVVIWLYVDKERVNISRITADDSIALRCEVDLSATKIASIIIPCIVLIIATVFAFRERNGEHYFYEPKFLSFTCIALCIIIVAFVPTFIYVKGTYTAFVMVFTMDVFGFTYLACILLPKCYVTHTRNKFGETAFKLKPSQEKEKKKDKPKKKKRKTESVSEVTQSTEFAGSTKSRSSTKSSVKFTEATIQPNDVIKDKSAPSNNDNTTFMTMEKTQTSDKTEPAPNVEVTSGNVKAEITTSDIQLTSEQSDGKSIGFTNPAFSQAEAPPYEEVAGNGNMNDIKE